MLSGVSCSRCHPFTPSQWQELEQQTLIFKYMASGIPIPSDLIVPIGSSFFFEPSTTMVSPAIAYPPHLSMGWGSFQLGFGRKAEDPEPGRCRRTDGKKWRCSKKAYPDSKYCEKHMHRGKNRSRKPVEMSLATTISSSSTTTSYPPPPSTATTFHPPSVYRHARLSVSSPEAYNFLPCPSNSSSKSQYQSSAYFHLETPSYTSAADKDYRHHHRMKDVDVDEYSSEPSGVFRGMDSLREKEHSTHSHYRVVRSKEEKQQHCFVLGADLKLEKPATSMETGQAAEKHLHHFFDEWPQKSKPSWMDLEEGHAKVPSYSTTQLSISIPVGHHEVSGFGSRCNKE